MPYLTATPNGPLHLRRVLTPQVLAEHGAPDANEGGGAGERKRKWWPF
ncbi:MAG: hypothetical protein HOV80_39495 [Polyangiaceae bacterium]|nr:hypothetical protein [Polyangiaceae bacterium]